MKFSELLKEYGVPQAPEGHEHVRSGWVQFDCPFCTRGMHHYRMGFNEAGKYVNCWSCGRHKLIETLSVAFEISLGKAWEHVKELDGGFRRTEPTPRGKLEIPYGVGKLWRGHRRYLKEVRKFDYGRLQQLWEVKGIGPDGGELAWRIFIPIFFQGRCVSWTTRSISDAVSKRYIAARPDQESFNHRTLLYGEDYCRHSVVVTEGPFDVWRVGPGAVCTFGTDYSRAQLDRIAAYPVRVICFDSPPDAQRKARELCDLLEPFPGDTYNVVLDSKDPGEAQDYEIARIRKQFLFDSLAA